MTDTTRYECCLCSYVETGERGDRSLIDHLVRAHDLDRSAVCEMRGRLVLALDGIDYYKNVNLYELDGKPTARVTDEGPRIDTEMPWSLP
jgi:hypothetical protein